MSLKQQAAAGVKWTTASMVVVSTIRLLQLMILARFLRPTDFGLMAIMMVVIGFAQAFADMGVSNAIIHHQKITHTQLSSLFWLNIAAGLMVTIIVAALSPLIHHYYAESDLLLPLLVLSILFLITSIGNQHRILFQKELRFNLIARIEITAAALSLGVAIYLGYAGAGIYALVGAAVTQATVGTVLFFGTGLNSHRPSWVYEHRSLAEFYSFGFYQMGERAINYISANIDSFLLARC